MIVKGSQRSGGRALAAHLLNLRDNEHVEVHQIDGCTARDVTGAFVEIEAMSRATRCTQPFFSVSISPPKGETVVVADFENAIAQVAATMGLSDQPRVILFHEKEARRHCHVVFSRIDAAEIKAINLPFFKRRLTEISRELYLIHGFDMPRGMADMSLANPLNFSLEEWQLAKRAQRDPREIKAALKQCWDRSDNAAAFAEALKERGFLLAQGDRRGFVTMDYRGNVYSLSRWLNVRPKEIAARLDGPKTLPTVSETEALIAQAVSGKTRELYDTIDRRHVEIIGPLLARRKEMVQRQRAERSKLIKEQRQQHEEQAADNIGQLRHGLKGLWDWLTGKRKAALLLMEAHAQQLTSTHAIQRQHLRDLHSRDRSTLQAEVDAARRLREAEHQSVLQVISQREVADRAFFHYDRVSSNFPSRAFGRDDHELH